LWEGGAWDVQAWDMRARDMRAWDSRAREGEGEGKGVPGVPTREGGRAGKGQGRLPEGAPGVPAQGGGRAERGRASEKGQGCPPEGAPGVPAWEGQAGQGVPDGHVHQAWRAYRIAHPRRRGPHRCDGVYPLQCQCSDWSVRSHRGDDVWGVSAPFAQPSPSMYSDWAGGFPYWVRPVHPWWKQVQLSKCA
jgi:hypothetical protein